MGSPSCAEELGPDSEELEETPVPQSADDFQLDDEQGSQNTIRLSELLPTVEEPVVQRPANDELLPSDTMEKVHAEMREKLGFKDPPLQL